MIDIHWVAVRCEVSEATLAVAETSEASIATWNIINTAGNLKHRLLLTSIKIIVKYVETLSEDESYIQFRVSYGLVVSRIPAWA